MANITGRLLTTQKPDCGSIYRILFAGINIVGTAILSAVESTKYAFAASISRGFVAIIFFAFILSAIFGLNGVWMAFPAAEFVTMLITLCGLRRIKFVDKNS